VGNVEKVSFESVNSTLQYASSGFARQHGLAVLAGVPALFALDQALAIEHGQFYDQKFFDDFKKKQEGDAGAVMAYDGSSHMTRSDSEHDSTSFSTETSAAGGGSSAGDGGAASSCGGGGAGRGS
jgi:hypothetical protein